MTTSNKVLAASQSQVSAEFNFEVATRFRGTITGLRLLPRVGQAQVIEIKLLLDNPGAAPGFEPYGEMLFQVTFYDQAFEEYNLYGQKKGTESTEAKPRQEEF